MKLINLPNIITCCNLLCGCLSIFYGFHDQIDLACLFIVAGAVFDFFDGMTARALHISGPIGKELDSLADVVSFGIAPSVLCYVIVRNIGGSEMLALSSFIMAAFSALRLAKFNCDERQTTSFIGLPTPANALFWIGLSYVAKLPQFEFLCNPYIILALMLVLSVLLISEIPMFSLKIKPGHMGIGENIVRYSFLAATVVLIAVFAIIGQVQASPAVIILLYIVLSAVSAKRQ
ncbi:MAG: CDP-diacylglycerol--serine O-phosphatidyltransferase [Bacteroidales bacterium]|jgi:CDP-diacylglycerol--serine O-phosphatidyltransferase|nr:CDP-diacylglycerol--serine O-phosphatidyltransferase [Bacteroidales bacterium]